MVLDSQLRSSHSSATQPQANPPVQYDVAIAGGGIVGLTLACALQDSGLRVAMIEAQSRTAGLQRHRAYAITLLSGQIFDGLGVWHDILPSITTFQHIRLAEETYPAVVDLAPGDLGRLADLGYVGEHHVLVQALLNRLDAAENITWYSPAELVKAAYTDQAATLILNMDGETHTLHTQLLVAADGARSPLRQAAGIGTKGWSYWQSCVTAVIRSEASHQNIAREHFWASGPFATLPLPGNRSQIVLTAPHEEAKHWLEVDESAFLAELERRYGGQLGKLELVGDRALFPVRLMQSDRYVQPRLALVGDAAHCCHPVGGQGLNLGIRDAAALAEVIKAAHQRHQDLGDVRVLKRYERWRKIENWAILGFTDVLDRLFSNHWFPIVAVRRLGLWGMKYLLPLRFLALKLMTGLSGRRPKLAAQGHYVAAARSGSDTEGTMR
ncbi:FAD-dependent hydroxylase [Leptolyngbya sp. AN02str]|uniref:FAD-dependent hydroxylase n=1 Tax=Leptolyngbya sp. AN02str TaxID=3423363 RepID=UPI003D31E7E1